MKSILLLATLTVAWESQFFEADYFLGNSLDHFSRGSCYYICEKYEKICYALAEMGCFNIEESPYLIEAAQNDLEVVKIWSKEPFKKVAHFLIISPDGEISDFSSNPDISPKEPFINHVDKNST